MHADVLPCQYGYGACLGFSVGDEARLGVSMLLIPAQCFQAATERHEAAVDGHALFQPSAHVARARRPLAPRQVHKRQAAPQARLGRTAAAACTQK